MNGIPRDRRIAAANGEEPALQDWREDALSELARELGIDPAPYYDGSRYIYVGAKRALLIAVTLANLKNTTDDVYITEDV